MTQQNDQVQVWTPWRNSTSLYVTPPRLKKLRMLCMRGGESITEYDIRNLNSVAHNIAGIKEIEPSGLEDHFNIWFWDPKISNALVEVLSNELFKEMVHPSTSPVAAAEERTLEVHSPTG